MATAMKHKQCSRRLYKVRESARDSFFRRCDWLANIIANNKKVGK